MSLCSHFNLKGQRMQAATKFPPEFARFTASTYVGRADLSPAEKCNLAAYDNATLYNDTVLDAIILSVRGQDAIVIYHSDHGEEVYDYRNHYGRTLGPMTPQMYKYIFHVLLVIYTTPEYRQHQRHEPHPP